MQSRPRLHTPSEGICLDKHHSACKGAAGGQPHVVAAAPQPVPPRSRTAPTPAPRPCRGLPLTLSMCVAVARGAFQRSSPRRARSERWRRPGDVHQQKRRESSCGCSATSPPRWPESRTASPIPAERRTRPGPPPPPHTCRQTCPKHQRQPFRSLPKRLFSKDGS